MKKTLSAALFLIASTCFAQNDPVIMRINGKNITRSEFEYSLNKNSSTPTKNAKEIQDYAQLFVNYHLKVEAAKDAHLDTVSSYLKEFKMYRDQQIMDHTTNHEYIDSIALDIYNRTKANMGTKGMIRVAHILLKVPQKANTDYLARQKNRIDSIYNILLAGGDFAELATKLSDDAASARQGGMLPWIVPNRTLKEFEDAAFALQPGEMSKPFLSTAGYHIIKMYERQQLAPYAEKKEEIVNLLKSRGINKQANADLIKKMLASHHNLKNQDEVLDFLCDSLCSNDKDLKYLIQEYHDGLLLYEISSKEVWKKAESNNAAIEALYKKNKKKYKWTSPHFRGIVCQAKSQEQIDEIEKIIKSKSNLDKWSDEIVKAFSERKNDIKIVKGIFEKGDNACVDSAIFKVESTTALPKYFRCFGKVEKKGPSSVDDVRSLVVSDIQEKLEKEWIETLRKKYSVEINQEILKTVNNHANK